MFTRIDFQALQSLKVKKAKFFLFYTPPPLFVYSIQINKE